MAEAPKSVLQALLSAELPPQLPQAQNPDLTNYLRKLHDWIRRLMGRITGDAITQEVINNYYTVVNNYITNVINNYYNSGALLGTLMDWRYDGTSKKFQVKRLVAGVGGGTPTVGDWEDTSGDQPVEVTNVVDWKYDGTTHKFQGKTRHEYVLSPAAAGDWTDWSGGQPVHKTKLVSSVDYSTSTHILSRDDDADVYVLESGSTTAGVNVNGATICGS